MVQTKRAAIYARVSTDTQDTARQLNDLHEYAARCGYEVVAVFTETASGAKNDRQERKKVMALAQARKIDAVLVTEMSRWGRSTQDLIATLQDLHGWGVSLVAQTGMTFDLSTSQGKLLAGILASLSEFERDIIRERVKSGIAAAQARGKRIGRQAGDNVKADRHGKEVMRLVTEGMSYREVAKKLKLSKTTVQKCVDTHRKKQATLLAV